MSLKEDIIQLREQGLSYNQIVEKLGCAKSTVHYHCNTTSKNKNNERQRNRRSTLRKLTDAAKEDKSCMDCGVPYPPFVLDFDHRPGEIKLFNIGSQLKDYSKQQILDEIAKCDIVCSNCHRFRTWIRQSKYLLDD